MKARIKETGEVIEVRSGCTPDGEFLCYYTPESSEEYSKYELDFNIYSETEISPIDWEQRRYEIAKDLMTHTLNPETFPLDGISRIEAQFCIEAADELIKQLKGGVK